MNRRDLLRSLGTSFVAAPLVDQFFSSVIHADHSSGDDLIPPQILDHLRGEQPAEASVRVERGAPRLFVNGREEFPLFAVSTNLTATAKSYRASGIRFLHPLLGLDSCWTGPGVYSWDLIDRYFGRLLELVPDAFFLPRLHLYAPGWWKNTHPRELIAYGVPVPPQSWHLEPRPLDSGFDWNSFQDPYAASLASEKWKEDMAGALREFLLHMEASPLRSRIIGYHIAGGLNGEWHYTGSRYLPDYSEPMAAAAGPIPSPERRLTTTHGLLRDPERESDIIQFYQDFHERATTAALHFCSVAKETTQRRVLVGLFHTYLLENVMIQEAGHLTPERVLASPDIDYIASPYSYLHTNNPDQKIWESDIYDGAGTWIGRARGVAGDGGHRVLAESIKRHGKLFIDEMDSSTYLEPRRSAEGGSGNNTVEGSLRILRRDLGQMTVTGIGGWLFDFGHLEPYRAHRGWYDDAPMIEEIRSWAELGEARPSMDFSSVAEVAAVYDPQTFFATRHWKAEDPWRGYGVSIIDFFDHWYCSVQARALHRLGAPMDFLYRKDLTRDDFTRYRLFVFPVSFSLTEDDVTTLRTFLRGSGATVVWFYAPGYVAPHRLDISQMQKLTGFSYHLLPTPGSMMIDVLDRFDDAGLPKRFGVDGVYSPRFAITNGDRAVQVLGRWSNSEEAAFASRTLDGWTSVYVGTGPVPAEILRTIARNAGVRLWSSKPDIIRACRDSAMIVATDTGLRTIELPKAMQSPGGTIAQRHKLVMEFGEVATFWKR